MTDLPTMTQAELIKIIEDHMRNMRDLWDKTLCPSCQGWGVRSYPNTTTWRGGIGGQMFTNDVCNKCWGSGDANNFWPSHRK